MSEVKTYSKEYLEYMAGIPKVKTAELTEIIDDHMVKLSLFFAKQYQLDAKTFINGFIKFPSIRTSCAFIVATYKHSGAFKECQESGKDFTVYAEKQPIPDKWKRVLAGVLLIIYSIINHV